MTIAVVAEKPSVARDLAAVLGAKTRREGYFEGAGYRVTWAIGHLVALAEPEGIDPSWKRWSFATLPMLPESFPLAVLPGTKDQFETVQRLLRAKDLQRVVCATDAGREGELIFRHIYEAAQCRKPVDRLWISSLTPDAIREGFRQLKPGSDFDALADAARGRSRADWLVGMNLSRAYSLLLDNPLSVGRVQTPTLALLTERELAIRAFVPEDYLEVVATFSPLLGTPGTTTLPYDGTWTRPLQGREGPDVSHATSRSPTATAGEGDREEEARALRRRLPADGLEAAAIVARTLRGKARVASVEGETKRLPPPFLYDLTELQRHANRLFGMSAQATLDAAQALYERHKLLSYPRTDSRHLSKAIAQTLPEVVEAIRERYPGQVAEGTGQRVLGRRFVDDGKVSDHHAILPTSVRANETSLNASEKRIYDLVCRRLLQAWHSDHVLRVTEVVTEITSSAEDGATPLVDRFESRGTAVEQVGWKVLDRKTEARRGASRSREAPKGTRAESETEGSDRSEREGWLAGDAQALPPGLAKGQRVAVVSAESVKKTTRPPPRYTEASLLTAMEHAGRQLEEKELSDAMKDLGLGTPATRATIIETLLKREYIERKGKVLEATDRGIELVATVHADVKSPIMTGEWEAKLRRLQRGEGSLDLFMRGIEDYVREVVGRVASSAKASGPPLPRPGEPSALAKRPSRPASLEPREEPLMAQPKLATPTRPSSTASGSPRTTRLATTTSPPAPAPRAPSTESRARPEMEPATPAPTLAPKRTRELRSPTPPSGLKKLLQETFGFAAFRPHQEEVCRAATEGQDLLLVMPTGAGKSLCYQLPGIARGGTTLVVSPLIALMDDQASKLDAQGLRAERIHSGRGRGESNRVCKEYLDGQLDFLFIAPERLRVPGFLDLLARGPLSLVAIDEAHCISQWGHDFRPDYRLLGQRLPQLRPAPILALTATATPRVQDDIVEQLGLERANRFIHGFRRDNLAIEVVDLNPGERAEAARELLRDRRRLPAIVYAPTRKSAEDITKAFGPREAAVYHAGMEAEERERVQASFLAGKVPVIVATTAFGMGIDKADVRTVVHAGLPGSLEGYYQEIGRAGRDGQPSRAVLMHSVVDRKTHEYFQERDYPPPEELRRVHDALRPKPILKDTLRRKTGLDAERLDKALTKLIALGGARLEVGDDESVAREDIDWEDDYVSQREHKQAQLDAMARFPGTHRCRMLHLVSHFGDQEDGGNSCGACDVCLPSGCIAKKFHEPSELERERLRQILGMLKGKSGLALGRLHRETFPDDSVDRRSFEHLLASLVSSGLVEVVEAAFSRDGERIPFQKARLTEAGDEVEGLEGPVGGWIAAPVRRRSAKGTSSRTSTAKARTTQAKSSSRTSLPEGKSASSASRSGRTSKTEPSPKAKKALSKSKWAMIRKAMQRRGES